MTISFTGDTFTSTQRVITGCHSLDEALKDSVGNVGWPLKSIAEVYGNKGVGKSTFCFSLMGLIAYQLEKNIIILDWEGQSKETIEGVLEGQGFEGNVNYILNKPDESSEETVERFIGELWDVSQNVALVDSIGGFTPTADLKGSIADANMGAFARETGRMVNKAKYIVIQPSDSPGVVFMTNHIHPTIGSMVQGQDTAGGVKKKYLSHVRIDLKRAYINNATVSFDDGWLLKGRVDDNRYGYSKKEFYVFMLGGGGIHIGLTALWDCIILKYAETSSKKSKITDSSVISMDGNSYGKMGKIIRERKEFDFTPFENRLKVQDYVEDDTESIQEETPKKRGKK